MKVLNTYKYYHIGCFNPLEQISMAIIRIRIYKRDKSGRIPIPGYYINLCYLIKNIQVSCKGLERFLSSQQLKCQLPSVWTRGWIPRTRAHSECACWAAYNSSLRLQRRASLQHAGKQHQLIASKLWILRDLDSTSKMNLYMHVYMYVHAYHKQKKRKIKNNFKKCLASRVSIKNICFAQVKHW